MNIAQKLTEIDALLYQVSVSRDDVFRMSQARQMLSELFAAFQAQKAEQKEE